ncbi:MAG TPA: SIS domain-containing protein [Chiayiivirga sp.]|nr:SIS domain-containing protein [Chiayiivirga sp.]
MHAIQFATPIRHAPTGGLYTTAEIAQQPELWNALAATLEATQIQLDSFLGDWLSNPLNRVILTGAGSSGFIAEMVADHIRAQWQADVRAVHSTSLLTHPRLYLQSDRPTLLVSFGRSGSSPESVAAVEAVREHVQHARFLDITCNADGELARLGRHRSDTCTVLMPPASCDRGFAMTSSLSCMLLAALTVLDAGPWTLRLQRLRALSALASEAGLHWDSAVAGLTHESYSRVIYLGSGPLEASAREAALKLQELTAGRIATFANTPMGFRHGPKSLLDAETLVVVMRSTQALARRYEQDLIAELRRDAVAARVFTLGPLMSGELDDISLSLPALPLLADAWLAPVWLGFAQRFAVQRSAAQGLAPDNPFPGGTVNRVVQGVTIHREG